MRREKHNWEKREEYIQLFGDADHHHVVEYEVCVYCGARR